MEKIIMVEKCKRCERLMAQRNKAAAAWKERHPEFEKSEARKKYRREWIKAYRKRLKEAKETSHSPSNARS